MVYELKKDYDVLVVGAGPSGISAATVLSKNGCRVLLVDKAPLGRDKVCGDALSPDAMGALTSLGCTHLVEQHWHRVSKLSISAPNKAKVEIRADTAFIPRAKFDELLITNAIANGTEFMPATAMTSLIERNGRVEGAVLSSQNRNGFTVRSDYVVLATGASVTALKEAQMCTRTTPSGMALRAYYKVPAGLMSEIEHFSISFQKEISPGYGWVFAGPNGIFNLGVGYFSDSARKPNSNLKVMWEHFLSMFPPAISIDRYGTRVSQPKGAAIRTAIRGAHFSRPGLLVAGEAIGTTYPLTGEGIGKAMQTGMLSAQCILANDGHPEQAYETCLRERFQARYEGYLTAQHWLAYPTVCNLLAARANRGSYVRTQIEEIFDEKRNPSELVSITGLIRTVFT
jgi:menaquinone-9 beta-reductase